MGISFDFIKTFMSSVFALGLTAYFLFHAIEGDRGILAFWSIRADVQKIEKVKEQVVERKEHLLRNVLGLRPETLDRDLLEERVRDVLNYVNQDEVILFYQ